MGVNLAFAINAGVSLLGGLFLLLLWQRDKTQVFAQSMGFAQLSSALAVLSVIAWQGPDGGPVGLGVIGAAAGSAAVFTFGGRALIQLAGRSLHPAWYGGGFALLALIYAIAIGRGPLQPYGVVNAVLYLALGVYGLRVLRHRGWAERGAAFIILLLGLNFLQMAFLGLSAAGQQLAVGSVLRTALVLAFAIAALDRTQHAIGRMRERFEKLSGQSMQGILLTDGNSVLYANPAAERLLALGNTSGPGGTLPLLQDLQLVNADEVAAVLRDGQPYTEVRRQARRSDGSQIPVRLSGWRTEWDDLAAMQLLILDDSERMRAEQQMAIVQAAHERERAEFVERSKNALLKSNAELEQRVLQRTQALERANQAKSQFMANMSHEIRTPMNAILGLLQLMRGTTLSPLQADYSDNAERAAKSLLSLLNDILDFAKIDAGKMELDIQPFEPERLLRDLSLVLSASAANKPVEVLFDLDSALPGLLLGDAMRLLQVLINLGSNALKFTPQGEVTIECRVQQSSLQAVTLRFAVHDTGIGIAPEKQTHIFEEFAQAEASTTRRYGGSGLGLAICKRLLEMMGSTLQMASTEGQGSRFYFDLHLPRPTVLDAEPQRLAQPAMGDLSVLVVDDNADALRILGIMASGLGWQVDTAASGAEALGLLQARQSSANTPYRVLVIDWEMAGMDGWQTLERMAALLPAPAMPQVVMVSSLGRERLAQRSAQELARLNSYLVKPVTPAMLAEAVTAAHQGRGNLRGAARAPVQRQNRLEGLRILLVEDNPLNQLVARELLRGEGALVETADNGAIGVEAVAAADPPFDVVLMDMQMPVMDGCSATRAIRQLERNQSLPVIAMTANTMQSDRDACLAAGMIDHVGKPFDINYLIQVLQHHTGRQPEPALGRASVAPPAALEDQTLAVEEAIKALADDRQLYADLLGIYLDELRLLPQQLSETLASDDRAAAHRLVHTLKGTSATLGALGFAAQARLFEQEIKNPAVDLQSLPGMATFLGALRHTEDRLRPIYEALRAKG